MFKISVTFQRYTFHLCKFLTSIKSFPRPVKHCCYDINPILKPYFRPILGEKICFSKNLAVSYTTSYGFLTPCKNLGKTNHPIPRKNLDRRTGGRADGQILFQTTLSATAVGQKRQMLLN